MTKGGKHVDPLVSVIIPVYNVEPYLRECLESVFKQTYRHIEIIAVNDGSTDNSLEILKKFAQQHDNMKIIDQKNQGNSVARNNGLEIARGKYIYFLDADDYILPETIGNLVSQMEKHQLDLIRFAAKPFSDDENFQDFDRNLYDYSKFFLEGKVYQKKDFLQANIRGFSPSPCLYTVKRDLLIKNNIWFKPNLLHEDELFSLEVYLNTNRAMYDANFYYMRRYRSGSIMTTQTEKKAFDAYYNVLGEISKLFKKYNHPDEIKLIKSRIRSIYISLTLKQIDKSYKREMLTKLTQLSNWEKIYYRAHYHGKEFLKKLLRM